MSMTYTVFIGETELDSFDVASNGNCGAMDQINAFIASLPVSFRKHIDVIDEYSLENIFDEMPYDYQPKPLTATQKKVIARYESFMGIEAEEDDSEDLGENCPCCNTKKELYGVPSSSKIPHKYACFKCIQKG